MKTPPYTPSSPVPSACCGGGGGELPEPALLAAQLDSADEAALSRATSDPLAQYISEMLRRPDVGDQVCGLCGEKDSETQGR